MSYFSDLLKGRVTFQTFVQESAGYIDHAFGGNPAVAQATGVVITDLKQAASDAISTGQSALGPIITDGAIALEALLEKALASATGGLSVVANPLINAGVDDIAKMLKATIDHWALKTKAELAQPASLQATPAPAPEATDQGILHLG